MMRLRTVILVTVMTLLALGPVEICCAQFDLVKPPVNDKDKFDYKWTWKFGTGTTAEPPENYSGNWSVGLSTTVYNGTTKTKDLTFTGQHLTKVHDEDMDKGAPVKRMLSGVSRPKPGEDPIKRAGSWIVRHPLMKDGSHRDVYHYRVSLPYIGDGAIQFDGTHSGQSLPTRWSYHPDKDGKYRILVTYQDQTKKDITGWRDGLKDHPGGYFGNLVVDPVHGAPIEYKGDYDDPGTTSTTLGFIAEDDTGLTRLDLSTGSMLIADSAEYFAPIFFNPAFNLYVGIDLVQWLSFPTSYNSFDQVDFVGGVNELYSGVTVGTSPILFDLARGYYSDHPYTGTTQIYGRLDGSLVPEPGGIALLASVGIAGAATLRRRRI